MEGVLFISYKDVKLMNEYSKNFTIFELIEKNSILPIKKIYLD